MSLSHLQLPASNLHSTINLLIMKKFPPDARGPLSLPIPFIKLLYLFFYTLSYPRTRAELYITATTYLQMGLDAHDEIEVTTSPANLSAQQQQILYGDLYSGLCYSLLAEEGEIALLSSLASAATVVTQMKLQNHICYGSSRWDRERLQLAQNYKSRVILDLFAFATPSLAVRELWDKLAATILLLHFVPTLPQVEITDDGRKFLSQTRYEGIGLIEKIGNSTVQQLLGSLFGRIK